jgi:hypothetical protein
MSIETQTRTEQIDELLDAIIPAVGEAAYENVSDKMKRLLLENELTGQRGDKLHFYDDDLGIEVEVYGTTSITNGEPSPQIVIDNLRSNETGGEKTVTIQSNGLMTLDGEPVTNTDKAIYLAEFAKFVVTLKRK